MVPISSQSDIAYRQIKEMIFHLELLPGTRVPELQIAANFKNPLMPSIASQADAMVKIASVVPEFAATEVFWEQLGFGEDMRQKVVQQMGANANQRAILSLMGGGSQAVE